MSPTFPPRISALNRNGAFGWTKLSYVAEIKEQKQAGPSFGLMAPGYFWIDDVSLEKVGDEVPLTEAPVLGNEEAPIAPPRTQRRTAGLSPRAHPSSLAPAASPAAIGMILAAAETSRADLS